MTSKSPSKQIILKKIVNIANAFTKCIPSVSHESHKNYTSKEPAAAGRPVCLGWV